MDDIACSMLRTQLYRDDGLSANVMTTCLRYESGLNTLDQILCTWLTFIGAGVHCVQMWRIDTYTIESAGGCAIRLYSSSRLEQPCCATYVADIGAPTVEL